VNEWYGAAAGTIGVNPYYTDFISDHLEDAGFVNIEETVIDIPIGEWHKDDCEYT
jgi:hypothetical protein